MLISFILVFVLSLGSASSVFASYESSTVIKDGDKVSAGFETSIKWMIDNKVTSVNPYNPRGLVTREQMAAFMYRLAGSPPLSSSAKAIVIKDGDKVSAGFETSIKWMMEEKITSINPYNPRSYVTREQMAAFMYRLAGGPELTDTAKAIVIKDADKMSAGFETSIQWMMENKITSVNPYSPRGLVTREQMAAFMYRLDSVAKETGGFEGPIGEGIGGEKDDPIVDDPGTGDDPKIEPTDMYWAGTPRFFYEYHPAIYRTEPEHIIWGAVEVVESVICRCGLEFYVGSPNGSSWTAHKRSHDGLPDELEWYSAHGGSVGSTYSFMDWITYPEHQVLVQAQYYEEICQWGGWKYTLTGEQVPLDLWPNRTGEPV